MIDDPGGAADSFRSAQQLLAQARNLEQEALRLETLQPTSAARMSRIAGLHKQYLEAAREARVAVAHYLPEEWDK
jgi:hypothetical protein